QAGVVALFAYYFLEYAAVAFIFAGCRYTATDRPPSRSFWLALLPAGFLAAALLGPPPVFFWRYTIHTTVLGLSWAACLAALWPALRRREIGPGARLVAVGLVLLTLDYLHHLPMAL